MANDALINLAVKFIILKRLKQNDLAMHELLLKESMDSALDVVRETAQYNKSSDYKRNQLNVLSNIAEIWESDSPIDYWKKVLSPDELAIWELKFRKRRQFVADAVVECKKIHCKESH